MKTPILVCLCLVVSIPLPARHKPKKDSAYVRPEQLRQNQVPDTSLTKLYPERVANQEMVPPHPGDPGATPGITEMRGAVAVALRLARIPEGPFELWLGIYNGQQITLQVDVGKFFMIDDIGKHLKVLSVSEFEYELNRVVAQNWRGGNYTIPLLPPPQRTYEIHGTELGTYEITPGLGGSTTISGHSTTTYTVEQQPDFASAFNFGAALGLALRQLSDNEANQRLLKARQSTLDLYKPVYFTSETPLFPGENRQGQLLVVPLDPGRTSVSYKVVLFLLNPNTNKEEAWEFRFHY